MDNVDTDQLLPARFMSVPRSEGYGTYLLYDLRRDAQGALRTDLALNQTPEASVLVAGRNFGSGSSREAAVYALVDAGIRVVIAPGFGDIFAGNAVNNGLLPARVSEADGIALQERLATGPLAAQVDLEDAMILMGGTRVPFHLEDDKTRKLINGWDDIDLTRQHAAQIETFRTTRLQTASWAWPIAAD